MELGARWPERSTIKHPKTNCFKGHGAAKDIDQTGQKVANLAACEKLCRSNFECSCIVYDAAKTTCWRRTTCTIAKCGSGAQYDTYIGGGTDSHSLAPWYLERMSGGPGILTPLLVNSSTSTPQTYNGHAPATSWGAGTPDSHVTIAAGVWTGDGAFSLTVPASTAGVKRILRLNVGCFKTTCQLRAKLKGGATKDSEPLVSTAGTTNVVFSIDFHGSIEVIWGQAPGAPGDGTGNVAFQAASLW